MNFQRVLISVFLFVCVIVLTNDASDFGWEWEIAVWAVAAAIGFFLRRKFRQGTAAVGASDSALERFRQNPESIVLGLALFVLAVAILVLGQAGLLGYNGDHPWTSFVFAMSSSFLGLYFLWAHLRGLMR